MSVGEYPNGNLALSPIKVSYRFKLLESVKKGKARIIQIISLDRMVIWANLAGQSAIMIARSRSLIDLVRSKSNPTSLSKPDCATWLCGVDQIACSCIMIAR